MAKTTLRTWEPASIAIDEGVSLDIRIKRLSIDEFARFDRLFWRGVLSEADRLVLVRLPGSDEQDQTTGSALSSERLAELTHTVQAWPPADDLAVDRLRTQYTAARALLRELVEELAPTDRFVVSDEEIRRRRLVGMSADERAAYDRLREEDLKAYADFLSEAIGKFIRVRPGQVAFVDDETDVETDVTTGQDFVRCFGGRSDVLREVVGEIRRVNQLSEAQKNASRSRSASSDSSSARDRTANGASSAPAAAPADVSAPATTAVVTPTADGPSGPTGT